MPLSTLLVYAYLLLPTNTDDIMFGEEVTPQYMGKARELNPQTSTPIQPPIDKASSFPSIPTPKKQFQEFETGCLPTFATKEYITLGPFGMIAPETNKNFRAEKSTKGPAGLYMGCKFVDVWFAL